MAGIFLAIGYGTTQRIWTARDTLQRQNESPFLKEKPFPRKMLNELKNRERSQIDDLQTTKELDQEAKLSIVKEAGQTDKHHRLLNEQNHTEKAKVGLEAKKISSGTPESESLANSQSPLPEVTHKKKIANDERLLNLKIFNKLFETLPEP